MQWLCKVAMRPNERPSHRNGPGTDVQVAVKGKPVDHRGPREAAYECHRPSRFWIVPPGSNTGYLAQRR